MCVCILRCVCGPRAAEGSGAAAVGVRLRLWELDGQREGQPRVMGQLEQRQQHGGRERPQQSLLQQHHPQE